MNLQLQHCQRLVVYGGSFDPPHIAHIKLPRLVAGEVQADQVLYVPAGQPPHKLDEQLSSAEHRLAMLRLALPEGNDAAIWTCELEQEGPSFTVRTLERLRQQLSPTAKMHLLMGADMAETFYTWRDPQRIVELADLLIMQRGSANADALAERLAKLNDPHDSSIWRRRIVNVPAIDVSSTMLRSRLAQGLHDDPLVRDTIDPKVLAYIRSHHLYRPPDK